MRLEFIACKYTGFIGITAQKQAVFSTKSHFTRMPYGIRTPLSSANNHKRFYLL